MNNFPLRYILGIKECKYYIFKNCGLILKQSNWVFGGLEKIRVGRKTKYTLNFFIFIMFPSLMYSCFVQLCTLHYLEQLTTKCSHNIAI